MRYWEERAKEWAKARDKKEHKINAALVDSYKNAADDLQKEIAAWYEKYADAEGISFADAKKRLDERERRALTRSVKAFEKLAKQNKDHSQDKILTKMSAAVHINRLTSMQFQMRYILYELYSDVNNELTDGLKEFYADEREQMAYEAQMARGKFEPIATIDEKRISAVLKTPWATDGKDFSARLWNNREQLVSTLQSELTRALITGADSASVAKTIAKKMNAAQYAASRLVSTEITRIITASDIDTFAEMDIDEVEVIGTLDLHTCDTCGDMDGNHMPRTEAKEGITAPPFHPNCRCVIVPYDEEFRDEYRIMRDPVTGKSKMIENMTFKEWKQKYGNRKSSASQNVAPKATQVAANGGIINIWDKISGAHTIEDDAKSVNPRFFLGTEEYTENCQRCVQAYELRRRGYNVMAKPRDLSRSNDPVRWGAECFAQPKSGQSFEEAAKSMFAFGKNQSDIRRELKAAPDDCVYVIYCIWPGRPIKAHVFIATKENGVTRYIDPQSGDMDVERYLKQGRKGCFGYCRIDDKPLTNDMNILGETAEGR